MVAVTVKSIKILNINFGILFNFLKFQVKFCSFHMWGVLADEAGWAKAIGGHMTLHVSVLLDT